MREFMAGRYGIDRLWRAILVFYLIAVIVTNAFYPYSKVVYYILFVASNALIIFGMYRVFSKNIEKRRQENQRWLSFVYSIQRAFKLERDKFSQRKTHKFVKCTKCKKVLRLPKNKGKIQVSCPHCSNSFIVNTGKKQKAHSK